MHERGNNRNNLLVIEIKKNNNKSDWEIDKKKLKAFTRVDKGYGYKLGVHLIIYINAQSHNPTYAWYIDGGEE